MWFLTLKVFLCLCAFDALGFGRDFAKMHRFISRQRVSSRTPLPNTIERVCDAVNEACIWYPKRVRCLQRSAVTNYVLRRCGVPAEMVMGAQKVPFKAHAWTEVAGQPINERRDVQRIYGVWERC
jgi:hypothetical protein